MVPASLGQRSLWLQSRLSPGDLAYHVTAVFRLTGALDTDALEQALNIVAQRHESLRTVFALDGDTVVQVVLPELPLTVPVHETAREDVESAVDAVINRPFDLAAGPLIRLHLLRLAPEEHLAVLAAHHIVTDAASSDVLLHELTLCYAARAAGQDPVLDELPIQYADFSAWHSDRLSGSHLQELTDHWSATLAGAQPLRLPTRSPAPSAGTAGGSHVFRIPSGRVDGLQDLARSHHATLFMVLLAGFDAVLSRYCRQHDITVVSPMEGRGQPELDGLIGYFVNPILLRTNLGGDPSFTELLERVRATCLAAFDRQEMPFELAVEQLRHHGMPGAEALAAGAMLVLQSPRPKQWRIAGLTMEILPPAAGPSKAGVVLDMRPAEGGLDGVLEYDTGVLSEQEAERLAGHIAAFLARAAQYPGHRLSRLLDASVAPDELPHAPGTAEGPFLDGSGPDREPVPFTAPRSPFEEEVAAVWADVLDCGPVGAHDNFFDLGGQSLAAVRLAVRLRDTFAVELSVRNDLYPEFTVAAVARRVYELASERHDGADGAGPSPERVRWEAERLGRTAPGQSTLALLPRPAGEARFRASPGQEGMWQSLSPERTAPLLTAAVRVSGPLDLERLAEAWQAMAGRHETLRSTYSWDDGRLTQIVAPEGRLVPAVFEADLADLPQLLRSEVDLAFDLTRDPPARLRVLRLGPDDHALLLVLHHIIGDGRTMEVMVRDLWAFYTGTADQLPVLPAQFADFAAWHHTLLAGDRGAELVSYWAGRLDGAEPAVLPCDLLPAPTTRPLGRSVDVPMPGEVFDALSQLAGKRRTTLNSVGLSAFLIMLARRSGQRDICVRSPITYRDATEVQDLVADFSNDVVIRVDLSGDPTYEEVLHRVEEATREGFARHELPPHLLEPHLPDPDLLSRLFHVQFTTETSVNVALRADRLSVAPLGLPFPYAYRPLSVRLRHGGEGPHTVWIFRQDMFSLPRVEALAAEYHEVITSMAEAPGSAALGPTS
ncbi:condensation domain-containing protein [Streptomyces bottropensis]|uniref:Condensation domain-containing protein n=1 Tax=Streptomyces bottropensis TaxID=42235 RepID=A0ABU8AXP3_9ACTN